MRARFVDPVADHTRGLRKARAVVVDRDRAVGQQPAVVLAAQWVGRVGTRVASVLAARARL